MHVHIFVITVTLTKFVTVLFVGSTGFAGIFVVQNTRKYFHCWDHHLVGEKQNTNITKDIIPHDFYQKAISEVNL